MDLQFPNLKKKKKKGNKKKISYETFFWSLTTIVFLSLSIEFLGTLSPKSSFHQKFSKKYYMSKKFSCHSQQLNFFNLPEKSLRVAQKNLVVQLIWPLIWQLKIVFSLPKKCWLVPKCFQVMPKKFWLPLLAIEIFESPCLMTESFWLPKLTTKLFKHCMKEFWHQPKCVG